MNKTLLIIAREYITRVRKKSFILMTFLGPVLFAALIVLPSMLATYEGKEVKTYAVVEYDVFGKPVPDSLQFFKDVIPDKDNIKFVYLNNTQIQDVLKTYDAGIYDGILFLSQNLISAGREAYVDLYYRKPPSVGVEMHISKSLEKHIFNNKLIINKVPADALQSLETKINLKRINWKNWQKGGVEDTTDLQRLLGYICGFLIYLFLFMFGSQVMRGVLEEKTSRIVEVIVSSVKPFQLMMGKIIGVGLTGLTQFLAWLILTFGISAAAQQIFRSEIPVQKTEQVAPASIMESGVSQVQNDSNKKEDIVTGIFKQLKQINLFLIIGMFIFYFIGGYILYGALFAAIGAASDNETDTQQFIFPITIPLIIGLFVMINTFLNPSGKLAVWFSIIPFTSPIVMMARIPFGIPPFSQLAASVILLIITFLAATWFAGKIYRTGILMYGKKVSYREIWKWLRY